MIGPLTDDTLESASNELTEVRGKIDATRKALEAAQGGQDDAAIRQALHTHIPHPQNKVTEVLIYKSFTTPRRIAEIASINRYAW